MATPGRAVDHLNRGSLKLDAVEAVILDEADEMLDMGFAEELDASVRHAGDARRPSSRPRSRRRSPGAARHLRDPIRVSVRARSPAESPVRLRQLAYVVRRPDKLAALGRILDVEDPSAALVFGRTRGEVDDLAEALSGRGHDAAALHGGMSQEQRDRVMGRFREGALDVLVATDVAARGLDIEHVSHVVNFDVPSSPDAYVHRIGRTGRAGREGTAITLVEPREHRLLVNIEAAMRTRLERATIPTVADLRERRLELLRARIGSVSTRATWSATAVLDPLAGEHDVAAIALGAIALLDTAEAPATTRRRRSRRRSCRRTAAAPGRPVAPGPLRSRGAPGQPPEVRRGARCGQASGRRVVGAPLRRRWAARRDPTGRLVGRSPPRQGSRDPSSGDPDRRQLSLVDVSARSSTR